tara:strand:- start:455 stop:568 length:114 start_codon:yes stop_codon:yes gene_type:complete
MQKGDKSMAGKEQLKAAFHMLSLGEKHKGFINQNSKD